MKHNYKNTKVGGGVWRLKWEPSKQEYLLSASMFNGAHIINTNDMSADICQSFGEKENRLFYGADWCSLSIDTTDKCLKSNRIITMCSFYDHKLDLFLVS